jgi:phage terminase large subunit-like protein
MANKKKLSYAERANRYAEQVRDGKIAVGRMVKAACVRHLNDRERSRSPKFPYEFNPDKVHLICEFAENMVHIKGKWATSGDGGLPFVKLEDWQCFLFGVPFGWVRKSDGLRRFREIYAEIPRKNGKSMVGAIIGLYLSFDDGENGAEGFAGATSMEQAYAVFRPAWLMVKNNPEFREHFGLQLGGTEANPGNIYQPSTGSYFKPIIGKPGDGDSPHCAVIDEYHEHATPVMYDAMKTGMGSRTQPMRVVITTAGVDTSGPCYDKHNEAVKVLEGSLDNPELFTLIYGIDSPKDENDMQADDWANFESWKKASPNFGVSVMEDYLRGQLRDALQKPSEQNINRTKHLNEWMNAGIAWMNMAKWGACRDESLRLDVFAKQECWLAFDLANKIDIASLAFIFRPQPDMYAFFCKHYLCEETIELRQNSHYRKWRDMGWLIQTDGARTDFRQIESEIKAAASLFAVQSLAFDPREASYLVSSIQDWASFECVEITQGPQMMSEPMKEMEAAIYSKQLRHCGDPILTWMMGNVIKKEGRTGGDVKYYYPTKQNNANKIDGVVAGIMALGRAMKADPGFIEYSGIQTVGSLTKK